MQVFSRLIRMLMLIPCLCSIPLLAGNAFNYDFSTGHDGWVGDFADYPVGEETFYELKWGWTTLPYRLPGNEKGIVLSGNNHSDDLMMFIKRQITGLEPNKEYQVSFTVTIESNISSGQTGIGGSPGESVYFKAGASTKEPVKKNESGFYRLNIDIGSQGAEGANGVVIGDLANPSVDPDNPVYMPKEMNTSRSIKTTADEQGKLWVLVGSDSGFEGLSAYYIANIKIDIE